jgi:hypothetical protein
MLGWKKAEKWISLEYDMEDLIYSPECPDTLPMPARAPMKAKSVVEVYMFVVSLILLDVVSES